MIEDENHLIAVFKHNKEFFVDIFGDDPEYELSTINCMSGRMRQYFDTFLWKNIKELPNGRYALNFSVKLTAHEMSEEEFKELFNDKDNR